MSTNKSNTSSIVTNLNTSFGVGDEAWYTALCKTLLSKNITIADWNAAMLKIASNAGSADALYTAIVAAVESIANAERGLDEHEIRIETNIAEIANCMQAIAAAASASKEYTDNAVANVTFEGLPDKPFGGTPPLNLTYTYSKGYVATSNGGMLYLQTDATRTVDELIGATASEMVYGNQISTALSRSKLKDESPDGIVFQVDYSYIYVVYSVEYTPTNSGVPTPSGVFPSVGIYFYQDPYGDYTTRSLVTQGNIKPLDNVYIDLKGHPDFRIYKHSVYINSGRVGQWEDEAKIYLSYVSTSDTPITTLAELINTPAVAVHKSGSSTYHYLQYAYASYDYSDESGGSRDVDRIMLTDKRITIYYVTAYTVPATVGYSYHEHGVGYKEVVITDTVTEV